MYVSMFWVGYAAGVVSVLALAIGLALFGQWRRKREIAYLAAVAKERGGEA